MFFTPTEAINQYKVSKPTLYKDMKDGTLSFKLDDRGKRKINVAELERIYKRKEKNHSKKDELNNVNDSIPDTFSNDDENAKDVEIKYLKKLIEKYENEVEVLMEALKRAQEGHNRATMLLENKSGAGDTEDIKTQLKIAEQKIINQIKSAREKIQTLLDTLEGQGAEISNYNLQFNAIKNTSLDINFSELESVLRSHRKLYKMLQTKLKKPTTQTKRSWFSLKRA